MASIGTAIARLPLRTLAVWLLASMFGWLCITLLGVGVEDLVSTASLSLGQVLAILGGVQAVVLGIGLSIFAMMVVAARHMPVPVHTGVSGANGPALLARHRRAHGLTPWQGASALR